MGYGLVVSFDPQLVELVNVVPAGENAQIHVNGNEIRMSWLNSGLKQENTLQELWLRLPFVYYLMCYQQTETFCIEPESHVIDAFGEKCLT